MKKYYARQLFLIYILIILTINLIVDTSDLYISVSSSEDYENPSIVSSGSPVFSWLDNGTSICTETSLQDGSDICSDGFGGAIIAWSDNRSGVMNRNIYAQRIDSTGSVLWVTNGVPICEATDNQISVKIISDGEGGAILVWEDRRKGGVDLDLYAQRINSTGDKLWAPSGIPICTAQEIQEGPAIISDGAKGVIVAWADWRSFFVDIYAQRINSSGATLWKDNGTAICTAPSTQGINEIISDGASGAIISWSDARSGFLENDIYAQRINSTGATLWEDNGTAICKEKSLQDQTRITYDGEQGAIIIWVDNRSKNDLGDIYAQRVNSTGATLWEDNGTAICTTLSFKPFLGIISDEAGGAILTWDTWEGGNFKDIFAQRINSTGGTLWENNGTAICSDENPQKTPHIAKDGVGGAVITWTDMRTDSFGDVYAQRINSNGTTLWDDNGTLICNALESGTGNNAEQESRRILTDGVEGAIILWQDKRNDTLLTENIDIYAQRLSFLLPPVVNGGGGGGGGGGGKKKKKARLFLDMRYMLY